MPRRTIHLPDSAEKLVREHAREGESFSATIVRLIELGAAEDVELGPLDDENEEFPLGYLGAGDSGLPGLGINAEKYLGLKPWGPGERPAGLDD
jgi:predicted CopG family antitoxin